MLSKKSKLLLLLNITSVAAQNSTSAIGTTIMGEVGTMDDINAMMYCMDFVNRQIVNDPNCTCQLFINLLTEVINLGTTTALKSCCVIENGVGVTNNMEFNDCLEQAVADGILNVLDFSQFNGGMGMDMGLMGAMVTGSMVGPTGTGAGAEVGTTGTTTMGATGVTTTIGATTSSAANGEKSVYGTQVATRS